MTLYDKLVINKLINGSFTDFTRDDSEVAMKDMIRYIKKMGGKVTETPTGWDIQCPYLWTGKIYKRFMSFGIRPALPSETEWLADTLEPDRGTSEDDESPVMKMLQRYSC